jgi:hypothetical protein
MGRRARTLAVGAIVAVQVATFAAAPSARAASILWSLTASPLAATVGVQRVFTMTATNEDPLAALSSNSEIGCVIVDVPGNFTVAGAAVTGSSAGGGWHVDSIAGNRVTVHTDSGGDRLEFLDWVGFTITATPFNTGSLTWNARAFRQQDCTGGAALVGVPPIVVVTAPAPTPTPVPTPPSTPTPTPRPTATPRPTVAPTSTPGISLPLPSLPVPLPSLPLPLPVPSPNEPAPSPTPRASTPEPLATPSETPDAEVSVPPPTGGGGNPGKPPAPDVAPAGDAAGAGQPISAPRIGFDDGELDLGLAGGGTLGDIGVWSVPAATLGVPGILLIVWVALQAVGALAWIPAVRRLRGDEEPIP